ncbi:hypothetical protein [Halopelagius fulvigenes]|uniref:Uncharacterized protein n=1 Tax=Halopelagius fulvigenes TaxID=1198324 RepID=A0ABD5TVC0_9EURY
MADYIRNAVEHYRTERTCRLTGYDMAELPETNIWSLVHPAYATATARCGGAGRGGDREGVGRGSARGREGGASAHCQKRKRRVG